MANQRGNISMGNISGNENLVGHGNTVIKSGAPDWATVLKKLHGAIAELPTRDRRVAQAVANDLEDEVAKPQPDKTRVQQLLMTLKQWGGAVAEVVIKAAASEAIKQALS